MFHYVDLSLAPYLSCEAEEIYWLLTADNAKKPDLHPHRRFVARSLQEVAERFNCEDRATMLKAFGVKAECLTPRVLPGGHGFISGYVAVEYEDNRQVYLDSIAASRIIDRLRSGLSLQEALIRTLPECKRVEYSKMEIEDLEQASWAAVRRADFEDRQKYGR